MAYWRARAESEGDLANFWYVRAFTEVFGRDASHYDGRRILDVGCGPRGSLEWAAGAARRVGLDPLVERYRELGIDEHAMEYVCAPAEAMPFEDGAFDVVSTFNSLDHVEDVDRAIAEMVRVVAPGGEVLLVLEVGRPPTVTEPHALGWDVVERFAPLSVADEQRYEQTSPAVYMDLLEVRRPHPGSGPGWLVARLAAT